MKSMLMYLLSAATAAATSMSAMADATFHPTNDEAGAINHVVPGKLTRAERQALEQAEAAHKDALWAFAGEEAGWELRQHAYSFSGGRMVHADDIPHDAPRSRFDPSDTSAGEGGA